MKTDMQTDIQKLSLQLFSCVKIVFPNIFFFRQLQSLQSHVANIPRWHIPHKGNVFPLKLSNNASSVMLEIPLQIKIP